MSIVDETQRQVDQYVNMEVFCAEQSWIHMDEKYCFSVGKDKDCNQLVRSVNTIDLASLLKPGGVDVHLVPKHWEGIPVRRVGPKIFLRKVVDIVLFKSPYCVWYAYHNVAENRVEHLVFISVEDIPDSCKSGRNGDSWRATVALSCILPEIDPSRFGCTRFRHRRRFYHRECTPSRCTTLAYGMRCIEPHPKRGGTCRNT